MMTTTELLEQLNRLPPAERLQVVESALHQIREELAGDGTTELAQAAERLLGDYVNDPELTAFTALDSEPFHA